MTKKTTTSENEGLNLKVGTVLVPLDACCDRETGEPITLPEDTVVYLDTGRVSRRGFKYEGTPKLEGPSIESRRNKIRANYTTDPDLHPTGHQPLEKVPYGPLLVELQNLPGVRVGTHFYTENAGIVIFFDTEDTWVLNYLARAISRRYAGASFVCKIADYDKPPCGVGMELQSIPKDKEESLGQALYLADYLRELRTSASSAVFRRHYGIK